MSTIPNFKKQDNVIKILESIDTSTFFLHHIPEEVKLSLPLVHNYINYDKRNIIIKIIKKTFEFIATDNNEKINLKINAQYFALTNSNEDVNYDEINIIISSVFLIIKTVIRNKVNTTTLKNDLIAMTFPTSFVDDICQYVKQYRQILEDKVLQNRITFPKLDKLRWRIDVTISTGRLSRVMLPTILFQIILRGGVVKTFEVSIEQFTQLRYGVAKMLSEMQKIEMHPIIKIINESKKREDEECNK